MKTAFYVTDCSASSAHLLRNWLAAQADESIRLTIVYPYDIEEGQPLTQNTLRPAKEEAQTLLKNWSTELAWTGTLLPETVLASQELALTIYLLIRSYSFWLVDDSTCIAQFSDILTKTSTQPCWLSALDVAHRNLEMAVC
ncbi:hypothetical protein [Spirosoma pollinicola]|uniref:UspA domain-containing protein n=1 Tax=Spirosoma pollinicola TaxID=2057025 RepID=A0A2K8Z321_9BACT|nr:hypothetical protein [Spirosoma pollinicola]AUD04272.1 hypothetical protein CWM47_21955 [Spirosoma pollinicola]